MKTTKLGLPTTTVMVLCAGSLLILSACSDDDDGGRVDSRVGDSRVSGKDSATGSRDGSTSRDAASAVSAGVCVRNDTNGTFCATYQGIPAINASAIASACGSNWGGTWTAGGACTAGTLVGTCTLTGSARGGATSAIIQVYEPTSAQTARDSICGDDGTWQAASSAQ